MSHEIHEFDNVLTVGQRAWHSLDENVAAATLEDVGQKVLNFQVFERPMHYVDPVTNETIEADHKITYRIVTDKETGMPKTVKLGEVGYAYNILQNEQFLNILKPIEESGLAAVETAGTLFNGAKTWVMFKLTSIEPVPGDRYDCYIAGFNSNDGSTSAGFVSTTVRIVCNNTWKQALHNKAARILSARHTTNIVMNLETIREAINLVSGGFIVTEQRLKELAQVTVQSEEQIRKVTKVVFDIQSTIDNAMKQYDMTVTEKTRKSRVLDDIVNLFEHGKGQDLPGVKGTGLALFNAITEYTNHYSGSDRKNASTPDSRLDSVLFGPSAKINDRAAEAVLKVLSK